MNTSRQDLINAIKYYLSSIYKESDEEYMEKMIAGVLAFIAVNYFQEPYYPVIGVEEVKKHWWEFWK